MNSSRIKVLLFLIGILLVTNLVLLLFFVLGKRDDDGPRDKQRTSHDRSSMMHDESLTIRNKIYPKTLRKPSSKIGLQNLDERYKLITKKPIAIDKTNDEFIVHLPLLKTD